MKNKKNIFLCLLFISQIGVCIDFKSSGDIGLSYTDNANLTNTSPEADESLRFSNFSTLKFNKYFKIKSRLKFTEFFEEKGNSNFGGELGLQGTVPTTKQFNIALYVAGFLQRYPHVPTSSTDQSSDNRGGKSALSADYSFDKNTVFTSISVARRNYTSLDRNDTDKIFSLGNDFEAMDNLTLSGEITLNGRDSTDSYYVSTGYGVSVGVDYGITKNWLVQPSASYGVTNYRNRDITITTASAEKKKTSSTLTSTTKEQQRLMILGLATEYNIWKFLKLGLEYTFLKNTSNNNSVEKEYRPDYQANEVMLKLGYVF